MDRLGVSLYSYAPYKGGQFLADYTYRCQPVFMTGRYGFLTCAITVWLTRMEMVQWADRLTAWMVISYYGQVVWEGRVEDFQPGDYGGNQVNLTMVAYGGIKAYSDLPYTAMWSNTRTDEWLAVEPTTLSSRQPGRYAITTDNQLSMAPNGGEAFDTNSIATLTWAIPNRSSRQVVAISCDYSFTAPTSSWVARLDTYTDAFAVVSSAAWSLTGNGATQTGTITLSGLAACDRLAFSLYLNRTSTTLGTAVAADTTVAVTPGSMTGIVKGSRLLIGGTEPEEVEVLSVTATQFTARYRAAHGTTDSVTPVWDGKTGDINLRLTNVRIKTTSSAAVYADEILRGLVSFLAATNPLHVSTATGSIQSPALDLRNETYLDMTPMAIIDALLAYGDTAGNVWEFVIWENLIPIYRIRGSGGRTWYMDITPQMERTLDALYNSAYAVHSDASGEERRTTTSTSALVNVTGITRRMVVSADTDSATQAGSIRDIALNDSVYGSASGDIVVPAIYDINGTRWPLCLVRAGDIIVARTYPVGSLSSADRTRAWVIGSTTYDATTYPHTLTISPETRGPRLAAYEARRKNQL